MTALWLALGALAVLGALVWLTNRTAWYFTRRDIRRMVRRIGVDETLAALDRSGLASKDPRMAAAIREEAAVVLLTEDQNDDGPDCGD